jgi:hypothetical protein
LILRTNFLQCKQNLVASFDPDRKDFAMIRNHLVAQERVLPESISWLGGELGIEIDQPELVDVLFFERFGSELSAVVLLPESMAKELPKPNRAIERAKAVSPRESGERYRPRPRVPRTDVGPGERTLGIESVNCPEVTLRLSTSRVSGWGIDLDLLKREPDIDGSHEGFLRWLDMNELPFEALTRDADDLLYAAFAVAMAAKKKPVVSFKAPRLPLIHNQRCGIRYTLYFGREKMGSPCDVHVLLYPNDRKPLLYGVPASERPTADEHKAGLAILQTWDKRVRFYQATDDQWEEWNRTPPDLKVLPEDLRNVVAKGCAAAERLRENENENQTSHN